MNQMSYKSYISRLVRRAGARFGTLRWRLTFSYFVTAFAALFILAGTFVGIPSLNALRNPPPLHAAPLAQGLEKQAPLVAPYISRTPPDLAGLAGWLHAPQDTVATYASGVAVDQESSFVVIPGKNAILFVFAENGQLLATLAPTVTGVGNLSGLQALSATHGVIAAALAGQTNPALLAQTLPDGRAVAAAPIKDTAGVTHGALVIGADLPALQQMTAASGLRGLAYSIILFSLIASVLGALIGLLMARGFTRRLRRLTVAADAWSKGDFAIEARDPSSDELGQLARDLNRMAEQLQTLLQDRQQLAVIEERNRLARDLHDSVKQQIFAVTMLVGSAQLEVTGNPEAQRILAEAERISSNAQQELTALIHELRPVAMAGKGLSAALRELCGDWSRRTGIAVEAQISDGLALAPLAEEEVYRTAQEALANIARHSCATQVSFRAEREQDRLALCIQDNGHGFNIALANGQGLGLRSMRERIERLGGTLFVFSAPEGTRVEASLPLVTPSAAATPPAATTPSAATAPLAGE